VLTGVAPAALGVARYYPYAFLRRACATLPGLLKRRGYATLALHPFNADFFQRDRAYPLMHFDHFLDITHFDGAPHVGPYVSDAGMADAIFAEIDQAPRSAPRFIFGITMENHGPLRLESVDKGETSQYHALGEDARWHDLTVYLRHVVNADAMIGTLLDRLRASQRPTVLCFYGDHVPGLHGAFRALGVMPVHSDYFIWRNFGDPPDPSVARRDVPAEALGVMTLAALRDGRSAG
jgi:phosphoglycerol transferase MdoB-like AlkP superfamily enzyme